jgi:hypothetical protein
MVLVAAIELVRMPMLSARRRPAHLSRGYARMRFLRKLEAQPAVDSPALPCPGF